MPEGAVLHDAEAGPGVVHKLIQIDACSLLNEASQLEQVANEILVVTLGQGESLAKGRKGPRE